MPRAGLGMVGSLPGRHRTAPVVVRAVPASHAAPARLAPHPPSNPSSARDAAALDAVKSTLLGCLLFLDSKDLLADWRRAALGSAPARAAQLLGGGGGAAGSGEAYAAALRDPHPALRLLLSVDAPAAVALLSEVTGGWDAVETDLRAAAGKPAEELERVLVATQVRARSAAPRALAVARAPRAARLGSSGIDVCSGVWTHSTPRSTTLVANRPRWWRTPLSA